MKKSSAQSLVVEWSPSLVRVFDPVDRQSSYGDSIQACVAGTHDGREAIIAVSQRSAFIRCLPVPNASRREIARVVEIQLDRLLPVSPRDYASGFRIGQDSSAKSRVAVVGAVKAESLARV